MKTHQQGLVQNKCKANILLTILGGKEASKTLVARSLKDSGPLEICNISLEESEELSTKIMP